MSVKISVLGSYALIVAPMGVKSGMEEGPSVPSSMPHFTPSMQSVAKPQNQPLNNLNTALCASCSAAGNEVMSSKKIGNFIKSY